MERKSRKINIWSGSDWTGIAQTSLVEHSLGPLKAIKEALVHETDYLYYESKAQHTASATVTWPLGFSPKDEFILWGTCAIILAQQEPDLNYYTSAKLHLRKLGLSPGGKNMGRLRSSIYRLGQASYFNDQFFDPVRKEKRSIGFGFLSHDLPYKSDSQRLWRISIDPIFFDFIRHAGGYLSFDLQLFRKLTPMEGRLFLFLRKLFYKMAVTQSFDLQNLAVKTLGCADGQAVWKYADNIKQCARKLEQLGVISALQELNLKGHRGIRFVRGEFWDKATSDKSGLQGLSKDPLRDGLKRIGLSPARISNVFKNYKLRAIREWLDVTQCGIESGHHFSNCPAAFFNHYLELARQGKMTPPDWYLALRKKELEIADEKDAVNCGVIGSSILSDSQALEHEYLDKNRARLESLIDEMTGQYISEGESEVRARRTAESMVRNTIKKTFQASKKSNKPNQAGSLINLEHLRNTLVSNS